MYLTILALGLAALLSWSSARDAELSRARAATAFVLFSLFSAFSMLWVRDPRPGGVRVFPESITAVAAAGLALPCLLYGALAFAVAGRSAGRAAAGCCLGAVAAVLGVFASRWVGLAEALGRLDCKFWAGAVGAAVPAAYAASLAVAALAMDIPELKPLRLRLAAGLFVLWPGATTLSESYMRSTQDYGPRDLGSAAGVAPAGSAMTVEVWELSGEAAARPRPALRAQATESLDLSLQSLVSLESYLRSRRLRGVFAREALQALRRGWLLWWDADKALEAATLAEFPTLPPDYRQALALLRAGPVTAERLDRLRELSRLAESHREGFESILQSQYIFEAFSTAFARFGEAEDARRWLYRIDGLWPVYEKKIEVSPLENMSDGEITGSIFIDAAPAVGVKVGLFYLSAATTTFRDGANLCCSAFPDAEGRFRFSGLGAGRYGLRSMVEPGALPGRVIGAPGVLELSESRRSLKLGPVVFLSGDGGPEALLQERNPPAHSPAPLRLH